MSWPLKNKFGRNEQARILKITTSILMECLSSICQTLLILFKGFLPNQRDHLPLTNCIHWNLHYMSLMETNFMSIVYIVLILKTVNLVNTNILNKLYMQFLQISASLILPSHVCYVAIQVIHLTIVQKLQILIWTLFHSKCHKNLCSLAICQLDLVSKMYHQLLYISMRKTT